MGLDGLCVVTEEGHDVAQQFELVGHQTTGELISEHRSVRLTCRE